VVAALGLAGFESGLAAVLAWPLWLRVAAVLTGGLVEEVLYRGYAITRLERLAGSPLVAAAVSVAVFALAQAPLWGPGPVVSFLFSGGFLAAFFLWRRDLVANVIAHVSVDALGLVFVPGAGE
jgi:membrane protease YdiL (CAAX protease family)